MDLDRRTILAFLLIGLVLIFMQTDLYRRWLYPKGSVPAKRAPYSQVKAPDEESAEGAVVTAESLIVRGESGVSLSPEKEAAERVVEVQTSLYAARLSTRGARVLSWRVLRYQGPDGEPVELVGDPERGNLSLRFVVGTDTVDTGEWIWEYQGPESVQVGAGENDTLTFSVRPREDLTIVKKVVVSDGRYDILMKVQLKGWDQIVGDKSYRLVWGGGIASSEARVSEDASYTRVYALLGKSLEKVDLGKAGSRQQAMSGVAKWLAGRTKYFTVAMIPEGEAGEGIEVKGWRTRARGADWKLYEFALRMPLVKEDQENAFRIFLGPLDYGVVKQYRVGLERMMDFGWSVIRPISKGILILFRWFHRFIPNYGVVLVIFSVLVKVVVYPLTRKSYVSMKQMQLLQPRLMELREKYGKDPQKLNRETMRLYKEYGVNPMSGCLPTLLQFPLLYALFIVFRSTIELRGAKFVWWIKDLSQPDIVYTLPFSIPLYGRGVSILPLAMGVTMFIQQKMTVTDPKQKAMVYLMPVFFVLLFNSFPSGLNLYYTLFNVLSIIQQEVIPEKAVELKPKEEGARKGRVLRKA
jgi:YidC/Oxa1 family membrane protein insertase